MTLFNEHHICVAAKSSPLANRRLSLEEVAATPQIIASPSRPNFKGSIDTWFKSYGLDRNIVISAPCFSVVPHYLATTDTLAFLPSRAIFNDQLIELDLEESPEGFKVIAAWHPRFSQDLLHNWIIGLLQKQYALI